MAILDVAADLSGSDSVTGDLSPVSLDLSGTLLGIATVTGDLGELVVFHSSFPLLGIATVTGDGGATNGLATIIPMAASLEGDDFLIGDGFVAEGEVVPPEPSSPCAVDYDIETCCVILLNG